MKKLLLTLVSLCLISVCACTKDPTGNPDGDNVHRNRVSSSDNFMGYQTRLQHLDPDRNGDIVHLFADSEQPVDMLYIVIDTDTLLTSSVLSYENDLVLQNLTVGQHDLKFCFDTAYTSLYRLNIEK